MNKNIDHECTSNIVCPYCGYEDCDSCEWNIGGVFGDYECKNCGKKFGCERSINVSYTTYK